MSNYILKVKDQEYRFSKDRSRNLSSFDRIDPFQSEIRTALSKLNITTSRFDPENVVVEVFEITYKDGEEKLQRQFRKEIQPPYEPLTAEHFYKLTDEVLSDLPEEFISYVRNTAYDRGHSSGYEEVYQITKEMVDDLKPLIQAYNKRMCL